MYLAFFNVFFCENNGHVDYIWTKLAEYIFVFYSLEVALQLPCVSFTLIRFTCISFNTSSTRVNVTDKMTRKS